MRSPPTRAVSYDVFISYSHHSDRGLAPGLQSGLQRVAKPWYRPRALRVFRDETDLTASPDLWDRIESVLVDSKWLVLMASPEAAASRWVGRELERWLGLGGADRLLIALGEGEMVWDQDAGDWDWKRTDALPRVLSGAFEAEPLWVDLRSIPRAQTFDRGNREFFNCIARIASQIRGLDLAELISQDYRFHARTMRLAWSAVALLAVLLVLAAGLGLWANRERSRAERQRRIALVGQARYVAQEADEARAQTPQRSLLFALEAIRVTRDVDGDVTPSAEQALRDSLAAAGGVPLDLWDGSVQAHFLGGDRVAAFSSSGTVKIWNLDRPQDRPLEIDLGPSRIDHLAATSDGRTIAVAGYDPTFVKVYELGTTLTEITTLAGHEGRVHELLFSPDDDWLAVGSDAPDVHLWRVDGLDEPPVQLSGHEPSIGRDVMNIRHMRFSPRGRWLATHGWDKTTRLWDLRQSQPSEEVWRADGSGSIVFSTDGNWLLLGGAETEEQETFHLHSLTGDHETVDFRVPRTTHPPNEAHLHPTGELVVIVAPGSAPRRRTLGRSTGRPTSTGPLIRVWATREPTDPTELPGYVAAFSADGRWLATAARDTNGDGHQVMLREVADLDAHPRTIEGFASEIESIAFSGGARPSLVIVDDEGAAWLLELDRLRDVDSRAALLGHGRGVGSVQVSDDDRWLLTTGRYGDAPRLWPVERLGAEPVRRRGPAGAPAWETLTRSGGRTSGPYGGLPTRLAFSPRGDELAVAITDGTVLLYETGDRAAPPVALIDERVMERSLDTPSAVAYAPDGSWLATARDESTVSLWRRSGSEVNETPLALPATVDPRERSSASGFAVSADGCWVAAGGRVGRVHVWDTRAPDTAPTALEFPDGFVVRLAFHPTRGQLVASGAGGELRVWTLPLPAEPIVLLPEGPAVAVYAGSGEWIVSAGQDAIVRLWRSGEPWTIPVLLRGHADEVISVAASRDGRVLATASFDGTVRIWNPTQAHAPPRILDVREFAALIVAVTPDGNRVAAACGDGYVRLWHTSDLARPPMLLRMTEGQLSDAMRPWALRFDPQGRRLAALANGEVRLWRTDIDELMDVAAQTAGRNLAIDEWELVFEREPYRLTAERWGLPPGFVDIADRIARSGDPSYAESLFAQAVAIAPGLRIDPAARSVRLAVEGALEMGHVAARKGERNAALAALQRIEEFDPDANLDAEEEVRRIEESQAEREDGERLVRQGKLDEGLRRLETAKQLDPGLDFEPAAQARRLLDAPALEKEAVALARDGEIEAAAQKFRDAYEHDPDMYRRDPETRAREIRAEIFRSKARKLAEDGDVEAAIAEFETALSINPKLRLDPGQEARKVAAPHVIAEARTHVARGEIREALAAFARGREFDAGVRVSGLDWNELCWQGCKAGFAADVLFACDRAEELDPDHGGYRDSRGVARALTGDIAGAIEDFRAFVPWARRNHRIESAEARERWIAAMESGTRPKSFEELEALGLPPEDE